MYMCIYLNLFYLARFFVVFLSCTRGFIVGPERGARITVAGVLPAVRCLFSYCVFTFTVIFT